MSLGGSNFAIVHQNLSAQCLQAAPVVVWLVQSPLKRKTHEENSSKFMYKLGHYDETYKPLTTLKQRQDVGVGKEGIPSLAGSMYLFIWLIKKYIC